MNATLLTIPEAARRLGKDKRTLRREIERTGRLLGVTPVRIGDRLHIPASALTPNEQVAS